MNDQLLGRLVLAFERIALAQERQAAVMEAQAQAHAGFQEAVTKSLDLSQFVAPSGSTIEIPTNGQSRDSGVAEEESIPTIVNAQAWYVDKPNTPEERIMVRLTDGTTREPTPEEARTLK